MTPEAADRILDQLDKALALHETAMHLALVGPGLSTEPDQLRAGYRIDVDAIRAKARADLREWLLTLEDHQ